MPRTYVKWTAEELTILEKFSQHGLSMRVTAKYLNRSWAAVSQKAAKMGIHFHGGVGGAPKGNDNRRIGEQRKKSQSATLRIK